MEAAQRADQVETWEVAPWGVLAEVWGPAPWVEQEQAWERVPRADLEQAWERAPWEEREQAWERVPWAGRAEAWGTDLWVDQVEARRKGTKVTINGPGPAQTYMLSACGQSGALFITLGIIVPYRIPVFSQCENFSGRTLRI
jgi:hypothetical protein